MRSNAPAWQRCSVAGVKPRKPINFEPVDDPDDQGVTVDDVERDLTDMFGGQWVGWHRGDAIAGSALWAQLDQDDTGRWRMVGALILGDGLRADDLRKVPIAAIENSVNLGVDRAEEVARDELAKLPPLRRTGDMSQEEWSELVAKHYRIWAQAVPNPGALMAAEWGVNRQTVGSWIREARLRGLLPPARAKKPGAKRSTKPASGSGPAMRA